jgi:dihydrofolate reductase
MSPVDRIGIGPLPRIPIILVAAVADNGVIGRQGGLPWRLKSDMAHFRAITMGKPLVMGRKTYTSIGGPLKGRTTIMVSRDRSLAVPGVLVAASLAAALDVARGDALRRGADAIAVIGGADLYAQCMGLADRLLITHVHLCPTGETRFPTIDAATWRAAVQTEHAAGPGDEAGFTLVEYVRIENGADARQGVAPASKDR